MTFCNVLYWLGVHPAQRYYRQLWSGRDTWIEYRASFEDNILGGPCYVKRLSYGKYVVYYPTFQDLHAEDWDVYKES